MPSFRRIKQRLLPPELNLHLERLSDSTLEKWDAIKHDNKILKNQSNQESFFEIVELILTSVENGQIRESEFIFMAAKAGNITGQLDRLLDITWRDQSPGVRAQSALAHAFKGQTTESLELLKVAERDAEKNEDIEILIEIWGIRTFTLSVQKKYQECIGEFIKASQVAINNDRLQQWLQWARIRQAYALLKLNYIADASKVSSETLSLAKKSGDRFFQALSLNSLGHCLDRVGRTEKALNQYNKGLILAKEIQAPSVMSLILNRIGMATAWRNKKLNESIDFFRRSIASAQAGCSIWLEFGPMANLAIVKKMKGELYEASELFEAVKDRCIETGDLNDRLFAYINLADIYQELGDEIKANESKKIAQELARQLRTDII